MKVLETDHWCLMLPSEWVAEYDDDIVRIMDSDEVGEIEITTFSKEDGNVIDDEPAELARDESPEVSKWLPASFGPFKGVCGEFVEDGAHITEWYMGGGSVLLYITYICDEENAGMDRGAVDEILATLVLGDDA